MRALPFRTSRRAAAALVAAALVAGCTGDATVGNVEAPDQPSAAAVDQPPVLADDPDGDDDSTPVADGGPGDLDTDSAAAIPQGQSGEGNPPGPDGVSTDGPPPVPPTRSALIADTRAMVTDAVEELGEGDELTVLVTDEYGREVVAHEAAQPLLPASTLKIVTAAAVLATLGPDAKLMTRVATTAIIRPDGVLAGDLVLDAVGDPSLATEEYARWVYPARPRSPLEKLADDIVATGVTRVNGSLLAMVEGFPGPSVPDGWPDRYFSSFDARHAAGLTVDAGLRTIVTYPHAPEPEADEAGDGSTDRDDGVEGPRDSGTDEELEDEELEDEEQDLGPPTVRVDHADDPTRHALDELLRLLEERGVEIVGGAKIGVVRPRTIATVARVSSPPMQELLQFAVQRSDNQLTDGLFRLVGRTVTGEGSWEQSAVALRAVLDELGVEHDDAVFADGSGLSRNDRVTARLLVELDRVMRAGPHREVWSAIMAEMGVSGTLSDRLRGTVAERRFVGKTGTLRDVTGLTGAILDRDGEARYHLAVLANAQADGRWIARVLTDELIQRLVADLDGCDVGEGSGESVLGRPPLAIAC